MAALELSAECMEPGDILAIEDGVLDDLGMREKYDGGPNRAISDFLSSHPESFRVATELCDMFGINATYNPNGYLRKL
jgi:cephalosporin hydroxylase